MLFFFVSYKIFLFVYYNFNFAVERRDQMLSRDNGRAIKKKTDYFFNFVLERRDQMHWKGNQGVIQKKFGGGSEITRGAYREFPMTDFSTLS